MMDDYIIQKLVEFYEIEFESITKIVRINKPIVIYDFIYLKKYLKQFKDIKDIVVEGK